MSFKKMWQKIKDNETVLDRLAHKLGGPYVEGIRLMVRGYLPWTEDKPFLLPSWLRIVLRFPGSPKAWEYYIGHAVAILSVPAVLYLLTYAYIGINC